MEQASRPPSRRNLPPAPGAGSPIPRRPFRRAVLQTALLAVAMAAAPAVERAEAAPAVVLSVDTAAVHHVIPDEIYGMNFADPLLAAELSLGVNRWGGNATTRYNYQNDTSNRASDWYFENIPNANDHPDQLPHGSSADRFVAANIGAGTPTVMTVPLIGWTPKSRVKECGFRISLYGSQQDSDWQWFPDCGNGIRPDGSAVTGNDPADTSTVADAAFVGAWVAHLVSVFGSADEGGVRFYNLDNEPMLWPHTHRDVHAAFTSYEEMKERTERFAAAVKAADPSAKTLGPVLWGWTAYFYSALDTAPGGSWWTDPQDRNAHGGLAFVDWYLQRMRDYEAAHGVRLLDYLDLHFYPQASGVALSASVDIATQARRLRSTRALWDPAYVDESWINEPVRLIPRMHDWVQQNYPGTRLAISEYNWGALGHINGALAQADILGIFGAFGLDLATLWAPPAANEPGAFAFRMFRNYDGQASRFGDQSLAATSSNRDEMAVYAARRSTDDALTVLVINKTGAPINARLDLDNSASRPQAEIYRYSGANLGAIQHLPDLPLSGEPLVADYPASSITLLVLKPAAVQPGDVDGDGAVTLADALISLRVAAGAAAPPVEATADLGGDQKIGLEEAIAILAELAE